MEKKWNNEKSALCEGVEAILRFANRKQLEWFRNNEAAINLILEEKNKLYSLWLSLGLERDRKKDDAACRAAR